MNDASATESGQTDESSGLKEPQPALGLDEAREPAGAEPDAHEAGEPDPQIPPDRAGDDAGSDEQRDAVEESLDPIPTGSPSPCAGRPITKKSTFINVAVLLAAVSAVLSVVAIGAALFIYLATVGHDDERADRILRSELEANWRRDLKRDAAFPGASLEGLRLQGLYAPGLDISAAQALDVDLSQSNLSGARLDGGQYGGASFSGAALSGASFRGADVSGADFSGALLVKADLRVAGAGGADFSDATLLKADLRGVDLRGAQIDPAAGPVCWDDATIWPEGVVPEAISCPVETEPEFVASVHYLMDTVVASHEESVIRWSDDAVISRGEVVTLASYFINTGGVPLDEVKLVVDLPSNDDGPLVEVVGPPTLWTADLPDGYQYPASAIQGEGRQINVDIGSFGGATTGSVEFSVRVRDDHPWLACGQHRLQLVAYLTPSGHGSVNDGAFIHYDAGDPCPDGPQ